MGLVHHSLSDKIVRKEAAVEHFEQLLFRESCKLAAHNTIRAAPLPWASSMGTDAQTTRLPHWVSPSLVVPNLPPSRLWVEMRKALYFHQWSEEDVTDEQCRLRVDERAMLLEGMVQVLEGRLQKEKMKLADLKDSLKGNVAA